MPLHPATHQWFTSSFEAATDVQLQAWPHIQAGEHTLIAAPTGSGKTLAAFLCAIDELVQLSMEGRLEDRTYVVYVSPLKALSNDIHRNLHRPLDGIDAVLKEMGLKPHGIRARVRTGDTTASERTSMSRNAPHILVTTPESLYLLLTSTGGRKMLSGTTTLIVDEIHAMVGSKRGSHFSLSVERLRQLTGRPFQRIGLSATQKPVELVANFLVGNAETDLDGNPHCAIIDTGHRRKLDLGIEIPRSPLSAVMANDVWEEIYDILEQHILAHQTTLIFVNTRRLAERLSHHLRERLGKSAVSAHHGSLSKEQRLDAEQKLKHGLLRAMVATASMELGIDIGSVDLVCQISSPKTISAFLQRVGRSGHFVGGLPKGRLFPLTRDDLVECTAILDAVRRGELDHIIMPEKPLDVLSQQIVAEVANREYDEDELYATMQRAFPYRNLSREEFDQILEMLGEGYTTRNGRSTAYLHRDAVNGMVRARKGAQLAALTNGGAIPDNFNYDVILQPSGTFIGTVEEDFAIESMAGDVFQLGNGVWKIEKLEMGKLMVQDAHGLTPSIPFWFGEAPGRSDELSLAVSRLRVEIADCIDLEQIIPGTSSEETLAEWGREALIWLAETVGVKGSAAEQMILYICSAKLALGELPGPDTIVMERFFDEAGDMHLVIHSPFGSRLNKGWGLALRKRFCRNFNFELQAAATEDAIILSLGATHSFQLEEVWDYLQPNTVRDILVQALLDAPMFGVRWRWNATRALAIQRRKASGRVAPHLQRMASEDLISLVFPDQLACLENIVGEREVPDHPLVRQTIEDCLTEAMDVGHLEVIIGRIVAGDFKLIAKDLREASPLAQEIINARPYAFLDPAGLEDRRTHAIKNRRWLDPSEAAELARLDPMAIEQVRQEAWPTVRNADELHEALLLLGFMTAEEGAIGDGENGWEHWFGELCRANRAALLTRPGSEAVIWVVAERIPEFEALFPEIHLEPKIKFPDRLTRREWEDTSARKELFRGRMEALGPVTTRELGASLGIPAHEAEYAMMALEAEGFLFRGQYTPSGEEEWCERRLLARIHRYTIKTLRAEVQPVSPATYMRFLFEWQKVLDRETLQGPESLLEILEQLEGYEAPAAAWEADILPLRMRHYEPMWLDMLCMAGRITWGRLRPPTGEGTRPGPIRSSPITILSRENADAWRAAQARPDAPILLSHRAEQVMAHLQRYGASFFDDLVRGTRMLPSHLEMALGELVTVGMVSSDSFTGLRMLVMTEEERAKKARKGLGMAMAGRWFGAAFTEFAEFSGFDSLPDPDEPEEMVRADFVNSVNSENSDPNSDLARGLLRRYGVVFRRLVEREANVPHWREMVRVFRRMEARGEVRGGRFVDGMWGEQYALPEAVTLLRKWRGKPAEGHLIAMSAADPLNLLGVFSLGHRLAAITSNRILYRDGEPIALMDGKEVRWLVDEEPGPKWEMQKLLVMKPLHH
ncbi:MAG: DEAD/DEAH box helicase [Bacteroidia bacterium]